MIFAVLWTMVVVGALGFFMRRSGRAPLLAGMVMGGLVLAVGTLAFLNDPTRGHYADFTVGAALDSLFLAGLVWLAFLKKNRTTERTR